MVVIVKTIGNLLDILQRWFGAIQIRISSLAVELVRNVYFTTCQY